MPLPTMSSSSSSPTSSSSGITSSGGAGGVTVVSGSRKRKLMMSHNKRTTTSASSSKKNKTFADATTTTTNDLDLISEESSSPSSSSQSSASAAAAAASPNNRRNNNHGHNNVARKGGGIRGNHEFQQSVSFRKHVLEMAKSQAEAAARAKMMDNKNDDNNGEEEVLPLPPEGTVSTSVGPLANTQLKSASREGDDEEESEVDESRPTFGGYNTGRWNTEEIGRYHDAIALYGDNWDKITDAVGTRSQKQVRKHALDMKGKTAPILPPKTSVATATAATLSLSQSSNAISSNSNIGGGGGGETPRCSSTSPALDATTTATTASTTTAPTNSIVYNTGRWTYDEVERYNRAIATYGDQNWDLITAAVGTRSQKQLRKHAIDVKRTRTTTISTSNSTTAGSTAACSKSQQLPPSSSSSFVVQVQAPSMGEGGVADTSTNRTVTASPPHSTAAAASPIILNSGLWTQDENDRFHRAIPVCGKNWKHVAEAVGTRTPKQVKKHYYDKVHVQVTAASTAAATAPLTNNTGMWTPEEIDRYNDAIGMYGKDWKKLAKVIGTRTHQQVQKHWYDSIKHLPPPPPPPPNAPINNTGGWTLEEIERYNYAIAIHGNDYEKVAGVVGTRTRKQIRMRFNNTKCKQNQAMNGVDNNNNNISKASAQSSTVQPSSLGHIAKKKKIPTTTGPPPIAVYDIASTDSAFVHNTGPWTTEEIERYNYAMSIYDQDWDKITAAVGTRSQKQVRKHAKDIKTMGYWTSDEIDRYNDAIAAYGQDWEKVAESVGTRSRKQCRKHFYDNKTTAARRLEKAKKSASSSNNDCNNQATVAAAKTTTTASASNAATEEEEEEDDDGEEEEEEEEEVVAFVREAHDNDVRLSSPATTSMSVTGAQQHDTSSNNNNDHDNMTYNLGRWSDGECDIFEKALEEYGCDWPQIQKEMGYIRSIKQIRKHEQDTRAKRRHKLHRKRRQQKGETYEATNNNVGPRIVEEGEGRGEEVRHLVNAVFHVVAAVFLFLIILLVSGIIEKPAIRALLPTTPSMATTVNSNSSPVPELLSAATETDRT